jgi:uncharacterized protein (TIGR02145 family)
MRTTLSILIPIIIIITIGSSLCGCKSEDKRLGELSGTVTDASTSQPLLNVKVVLNRFVDSTTTTSDGKYFFKGINPGNYDIQVTKHAYERKSGSASVSEGKSTEINFTLNSIPEPKISQKVLDFGIDSTIKYFTITNVIPADIDFSIITNQNWISVEPASGRLTNGINTIKVTINKTDLSDIHYGEIQIISIIGQEVLRDTMKVLTNGVMDNDLNYYSVIEIGSQIWMAQNLKVGELISGGKEMDGQTIKKYCYKNNSDYGTIYGGLYTWRGMMQDAAPGGKVRGICPVGWHIPSMGDWSNLTNYLGETVAGLKIKEAGTSHWKPGTLANNQSGFTALPAGIWDGYSFSLGPDMSFNLQTYFWTSSNDQATGTHFAAQIGDNSERVLWITFGNSEALSVRCIKDSSK